MVLTAAGGAALAGASPSQVAQLGDLSTVLLRIAGVLLTACFTLGSLALFLAGLRHTSRRQ